MICGRYNLYGNTSNTKAPHLQQKNGNDKAMNENDFIGIQQSPPAFPSHILLENELSDNHIDDTQ